MKRRWRQKMEHTPAELNITAFMNLMVILVPFLLITAVFSQVTILELNLPASSDGESSPEKKLILEITIRDDGIEVGDRDGGRIKSIPNTEDGHDLESLSMLLKEVKARYPEKLDATVLVEPDVSYDTLIQVMDAVRVAPVVEGGSMVHAELFPEISIGDAPVSGQ